MNDAPSRLERVLNLLALLLDARRPLTRDEIVREVAGYPAELSAYRRAFERDKETLRAMGVPVRTETDGGGEVGYRVVPEEYALPDLDLTPEETAALHVAVSAVSVGSAAGEGALLKLGGRVGDAAPPLASVPLVPALAPLFDAVRRRAVVRFAYRDGTREVEPWGLTSRRGRWYLVGHDRDRAALRSFRADRIPGEVEVGAPGSFTVPEDFRPDEHLEDRAWLLGDGEPVTVRLLVDPSHAAVATERLGADHVATSGPDGVVLEVPVVDRAAFRSVVLDLLEHAEVLGPDEVRAEIVTWLRHVAGIP